MSLGDDAPLAGANGWSERTCPVGGREQHWLERTIDAATGHVEQFHGRYEYASRTTDVVAPVRGSAAPTPVVRARPARTVERPVAPVALHTSPCGLTVHIGTGALQTIHDEIQAHRAGIEVLGYETGGGIFGPPIRGWHTRADVAVATVAAGPRQRNAVEIAYGKIEATEASLIRVHGSQLRRIGDWHVTRVVLPAASESRPTATWVRGSASSTGSTAAEAQRGTSASSPPPAHAAGHQDRACTPGSSAATAAADRSANPQPSPRVATHARRDVARPRPRRSGSW